MNYEDFKKGSKKLLEEANKYNKIPYTKCHLNEAVEQATKVDNLCEMLNVLGINTLINTRTYVDVNGVSRLYIDSVVTQMGRNVVQYRTRKSCKLLKS